MIFLTINRNIATIILQFLNWIVFFLHKQKGIGLFWEKTRKENSVKKKKGKFLKKKQAKKIVDMVAAIMYELGIDGAVAVVDQDDNFIDGFIQGNARPITLAIATNKASQSSQTGARTGDTAKKIASGERTLELFGLDEKTFVPFAGGCPIYSKDGVRLGGAGFSEQTAVTDQRIICAAVEACGFLSNTPTFEDIPEEVIKSAVKRIKKREKKKKK